MVPVEAYISMVTGSSSEEDSETDDQSYIPPEVYDLSCNVYISHMMHMVSCIAMPSAQIIYASTGTIACSEDLVFTPDFSITGSNG